MPFLSLTNLKTLITLVGLCNFFQHFAQTTDSLRVITENGWIEKLDQYIGLDVSLNNSYEIFEVRTPQNNLVIYPNTP